MCLDAPRRGLLLNAALFSVSFAVLEGCISATIIISQAVVQPGLASAANAVLYLFFSLFTLAAPAVVAAAGVKRALVGSSFAYIFYCAAYMAPVPNVLFPAAVIGGIAGAVLWTAQGAYFVQNATALADTDRSGSPLSSSLDLLAGLFAFFFQASLALGKPLAALCLTAWPDQPAILFGAYSAVAFACTCGMALVRPLGASAAMPSLRDAPRLTTAQTESEMQPPLAAPPPSTQPPSTQPPSAKAPHRASSSVDAGASATDVASAAGAVAAPPAPVATRLLSRGRLLSQLRDALCGPTSLGPLLLDPKMALLTPTNAAFGLMTALFPSVVGPLVRDGFGAAAVGWLFAIAGATSACATVLTTLYARAHPAGRNVAMGGGAVLFGAAAARLVACADECGALRREELVMIFVCYGCGVAAWQSCVMALVGELHGAPSQCSAAFGQLKLTSGLSSFLGFLLLPRLGTRAAAATCLAVVIVGAVGLATLLWSLLIPSRARGQRLLSSYRASVLIVSSSAPTVMPVSSISRV